MNNKIFLIISDEEIIFHQKDIIKNYYIKDNVATIQIEIQELLSLTPKAPLYLLIDRHHQDVREEELPSLFPWDRLRLLYHKKIEWASQKGVYGYRCFKQDKRLFLQWVNIAQKDPLMAWLFWVRTLSNPCKNIFFVSLEAGQFLASPHYRVVIYQLTGQTKRYVIFKGERLLLFRPFQDEEDMRKSLHFLSRTHPDIHEELQILNHPSNFEEFLYTRCKPTLALNLRFKRQSHWAYLIFGCLLFVAVGGIYGAWIYKSRAQVLFTQIPGLQHQKQQVKMSLQRQDIPCLRQALSQYATVKAQMRDPFPVIERLSQVLKKHNLRLESLTWQDEQGIKVNIRFFLPYDHARVLSKQFQALLASLGEALPRSHIQIIEAPFKSGTHETYIYPSTTPYPMATVEMRLP